jgi:hypothetical protein
MRKSLALMALLYSAAAFAQGTAPQGTPPQAAAPQAAPVRSASATAEGKPVSARPPRETASKTKSVAEKAQACLLIDDATIARLNCYDAAVPPKLMPKPPVIKGILDCRHVKEQDERLACFNNFAEQIPKFTH